MWKKPETPLAIHPSQVVIGLYVWLDLPWDDHPFIYNRFKIANDKQIATIRSLSLDGKLFYYPDKSAAVPGDIVELGEGDSQEALQPETAVEIAPAVAHQNQGKHEQLRKLKENAARADRAWEKAARVTREAIVGMANSPKQSGVHLQDFSKTTANQIFQGQEVLLHLLGDKDGEGPQFHALNVMTLSMLLGKLVGFDEIQLAELALGALAHDIGKAKVPLHLLKAKTRAKHEEGLYRQHSAYGVELAKISGAFGPIALSVIADHHECLDGSGWPVGKTEISTAARIVALVNRYDRLCCPESPERDPLMPSEALARLFRSEAGKFDVRFLNMLIRLLGVYPPGTLVRFNDESLGLVVSPGKDTLRPTVLIFSPEMDRRDAPTIDLAQHEELKIEEALRPAALPPDVLEWMNPRQRLSYFFSTDLGN